VPQRGEAGELEPDECLGGVVGTGRPVEHRRRELLASSRRPHCPEVPDRLDHELGTQRRVLRQQLEGAQAEARGVGRSGGRQGGRRVAQARDRIQVTGRRGLREHGGDLQRRRAASEQHVGGVPASTRPSAVGMPAATPRG
jgi:hypothetical protein